MRGQLGLLLSTPPPTRTAGPTAWRAAATTPRLTMLSIRLARISFTILAALLSLSLNTLSITLSSVDVVSSPQKAAQSLTTSPAPMTSLPRLTVPATSGTCSRLDSSSRSSTLVCRGRHGRQTTSNDQQQGCEWRQRATMPVQTARRGILRHSTASGRPCAARQGKRVAAGWPAHLWRHQASLVGELAVAAHQHVAGDGLAEHLHPEHIRHYLLRLLHTTGAAVNFKHPLVTSARAGRASEQLRSAPPQPARCPTAPHPAHLVDVGMYQGDVVVAGYAVAQRG